MSERPYDEAAFPVPDAGAWQYAGMSVRDFMAAAALQGVGTWMPHATGSGLGLHDSAVLEARARWAYRQADVMLVERGR